MYGDRLWDAIISSGVPAEPVYIGSVADGLYIEYIKSVGLNRILTLCSNSFTDESNATSTPDPLIIHSPAEVKLPDAPVTGLMTAIPLS